MILHQPARGAGYRVNADALLLADFAGAAKGTLFDLGAGAGAVALVMIARGLAPRAVLVDDDRAMCTYAEANVAANRATATVLFADVLEAASKHRGEAALVVCNPPYFAPGSGRSGGVGVGRDRARVGDLDPFVRAARSLLGPRGRTCFVYPASDLARLFMSLQACGLEPKRLCMVHARISTPARVALVEARASKAGGLVTLPPLVERSGPGHGEYTPETARALGLAR